MLYFDDYYEMLNLYKMLIEAKFCIEPNNEYISGSPIAAQICEKVVNALMAAEREKTGSDRKWREFLKIKSHTVFTKDFINAQRMQLVNDGFGDEEINSIIDNMKKDKHNFTIWEIALMNAKKDDRWEDADRAQQAAMAKDYLSPFVCSDGEIDEFISCVLNG